MCLSLQTSENHTSDVNVSHYAYFTKKYSFSTTDLLEVLFKSTGTHKMEPMLDITGHIIITVTVIIPAEHEHQAMY